jgi:hypothetical protein
MYSHNIEPLVADLGGMLLGPTLPTFACYTIRIFQYMLTVLSSMRYGLHFKKSEITGQQLSMGYFLSPLHYYLINGEKKNYSIAWYNLDSNSKEQE